MTSVVVDEDVKDENFENPKSTVEAAVSGSTAHNTRTDPVVAKEEATTTVSSTLGEEYEESDEPEIFSVVEQMPEFPGGMNALLSYLSKSMKYPSVAQENNIQGRVYVTFVVNRDGSIVDPAVINTEPYTRIK